MTKALLTIIRKQVDEVLKDAPRDEAAQEHLASTLRSISQLLEDLDRRIDALERRR